MAGESLLDLGILLNNEFQALLGNSTNGWLAEDVFRSEDWQEIALLCQEVYQVEQAINELEAWKNLLTTGFIPSDLASANNSNQGKESASNEPAKIHPYLETLKRYQSFVNSAMPIPLGNGKSSEQKLPTHSNLQALERADFLVNSERRISDAGESSYQELPTNSDLPFLPNVDKKPQTPTSPQPLSNSPRQGERHRINTFSQGEETAKLSSSLRGEEREITVFSEGEETENFTSSLSRQESREKRLNQFSAQTENNSENPAEESQVADVFSKDEDKGIFWEEAGFFKVNTRVDPPLMPVKKSVRKPISKVEEAGFLKEIAVQNPVWESIPKEEETGFLEEIAVQNPVWESITKDEETGFLKEIALQNPVSELSEIHPQIHSQNLPNVNRPILSWQENRQQKLNQFSAQTENNPDKPAEEYQVTDVFSEDEFVEETQPQNSSNINRPFLPALQTSPNPSYSAPNSQGIKGLRDLSAFLASQPNREHIIESEELSNYDSEITVFAETDLADSREKSKKKVNYFSEEVKDAIFLEETEEIEFETQPEIVYERRDKSNIIEPAAMTNFQTPEIDREMIVELFTEEINREYRRFYGE
ncbi:hypothetical protein NG798_00415 [Ancylothrix sp. C2]|nr:hypothetical protein [Ancylothrix sp. D3o]